MKITDDGIVQERGMNSKKISIIIDESAPDDGCEYGTPAKLTKKDANCPDCGKVHDIESCPDCGADIVLGFGLCIAPGFGPYKLCEKGCGWFWKKALPAEDC